MGYLTTHVLDTARGCPAEGMRITLVRLEGAGGEILAESVTRGFTKYLREWMFCIAFVSIGLETNFPALMKSLKGGKAVTLYIIGQAFSLVLSLTMCWLMLKVVFPDVIQKLNGG